MCKLTKRIIMYMALWYVIEKIFFLDYRSEVWGIIFIGFEAALIGLMSLKNNNDQLEIELFTQFNKRYSELNEHIRQSFDSWGNEKLDDQQKKLEDYLNLCCEEYYCYRVKKKIPHRIWKFWHSGIMYNWWSSKALRKLWEKEYSNTNSFYIRNGDHPFKDEAIRENHSCFSNCLKKIESIFY